jgi:hypothetical protein
VHFQSHIRIMEQLSLSVLKGSNWESWVGNHYIIVISLAWKCISGNISTMIPKSIEHILCFPWLCVVSFPSGWIDL